MNNDIFVAALRRTKLRLLKMHKQANAGHIGGNLSSLDAVLLLHIETMGPLDSFILSKGHSAGALYASLWAAGKLSDEQLSTYAMDGSFLAAHPSGGWHPGISFSTGSLGHGISLAAGVALGRKLLQKPGHVYCLMSDGELQEGSSWEAFTFAKHHGLDNLTVLIDHNGLQGFGRVEEVASPMLPLSKKVAAFGWDVMTVDGHSYEDLHAALVAPCGVGMTRAIIMKTVKGHGVSFMEDKMEWHYLPMSDEQYEQAVREVGEVT